MDNLILELTKEELLDAVLLKNKWQKVSLGFWVKDFYYIGNVNEETRWCYENGEVWCVCSGHRRYRLPEGKINKQDISIYDIYETMYRIWKRVDKIEDLVCIPTWLRTSKGDFNVN